MFTYQHSFAQNSMLADGAIYKLATKQEGVFKLDRNFLEKLGINASTIDPRKIQVLGHGGGTLPERNDEPRIEDLFQLSIYVSGQDDGVFDASDYILFYGEGSDKWIYDKSEKTYHKEENPYDDRNYYFLKIGEENGKRITSSEGGENATYITNTFSAKQHHQRDLTNLLHSAGDANLQGSGRIWGGESFRTTRKIDFTTSFDFTDAVLSEPVFVNLQFIGRSSKTSTVILNVGSSRETANISSSEVFEIEAEYAKFGRIQKNISLNTNAPTISIDYPNLGNDNHGWLDYLEFNFRSNLVYQGDQIIFSDVEAPEGQTCQYDINSSVSEIQIWDITNSLEPQEVILQGSAPSFSFLTQQKELSTFVAYDLQHTLEAEPVGKIENQNLHAMEEVDYLVIYHPNFKEATDKIVAHRKSHNNFSIESVTIEQVLNEFSSGKTDPSAIRDFARYIRARSSNFKYLLLVGDGSFDYRHIYSDLEDQSFIPVYETELSFHPIYSFPSDDYYALLDDREGGSWRGALDIAVGRLCVRTADEANIVAKKIIDYETNEKMEGDWRNRVLFVADDEDRDRHLNSADEIAERTKLKYPNFNVNKIYFDAYVQENTPGGTFNFNAKEALNQSLLKGQLVVNYIGHGGSTGWAQERVLQVEDIGKWDNIDRLPLLVTATCSFAGYDDPSAISAGELTLTNPTGGAIALFTTVRAVYAGNNERLTKSVFDHIFEPVDGVMPTLGEILVNSKNATAADTAGSNARKFTLLGDPAMRLALPPYTVSTTKINGVPVEGSTLDTLKAFSKVDVEGEVRDQSGGLLSSYNGKVYPTIFDKELTLKTLAQDDGSTEKAFRLQKSVIFKGLASVVNGKFKFSFVVPKDINYSFGKGKISYYANAEDQEDAAGSFNDVAVGGTDEQGINDTEGPEIDLYMDDESFIYGGITKKDPVLLVNLSDANGINVIGNSIGHDLTAVIDGDLQSVLLLNEFYEAAQDDHTGGKVSYPLSDLEVGPHTLTVKAWDIANNSSEALVEFVVVDEAEAGLRHVLNYPNPFSTNTSFQFEHQLQNQDLTIRVEILNPSGQIVQVLEEFVQATGIISRDVTWDGRDDFGDPLANGVYIYRVTVTAQDSQGRLMKHVSNLEKLVILR